MKTTRASHTPSRDRKKSNASSNSSLKNLTRPTVASSTKRIPQHKSKDQVYYTNQTLQHIPQRLIPDKLSPNRKTIYSKQSPRPSSQCSTPGFNYEERLKFLECSYQERVVNLEEAVKQLREEVRDDQIITALKEDVTSQEFIQMRIKEIVDEGIANQKETQIHRLMQDKASLQCTLQESLEQIKSLTHAMNTEASRTSEVLESQRQAISHKERETAELKNKLALKEKEAIRLAGEIKEIQESYTCQAQAARKRASAEKHSLESELELYKRTLGELETKFKAVENKRAMLETQNQEHAQDSAICKEGFQRLKLEVEPLKKQNQILREHLEDTARKLQKAEEMALLAESQKNELLEKFKKIGENIQMQNSQMMEKLKEKQKKKKKELKDKLTDARVELQNVHIQRQQELRDNERATEQLEAALKSMHQDIQRVHHQWESKCKELELEKDRKEAELKSVHSFQTEQLQNQYQHLLEAKIQEIESLRAQELGSEERRGGGYVSQDIHQQRLEDLRQQHSREINEFKQEVKKQLQEHQHQREEEILSKNHLLDMHVEKMQQRLETNESKQEQLVKQMEEKEMLEHQLRNVIEQERAARQELEGIMDKIGNKVLEACQSLCSSLGEMGGPMVNNYEMYLKMLHKLSKKVGEMMEEQQEEIRRLQRKVKEEERKANDSKNNSLEMTTQIGKEMQSEIEHVRKQLRESEAKNRMLQEANDDYERARTTAKAKLGRAESQVLSLRDKLMEEENVVAGLTQEKKNGIIRILRLKEKIQSLQIMISQKLRNTTRKLREEMQKIRMETQSQNITMATIASGGTRDMLRMLGKQEDLLRGNYQKGMREFKEKLSQQMTIKLSSQEHRFTMNSETLKEQLEGEKEEIVRTMREEQKKWRSHFEDQIEKLEIDKENLMIKLQEVKRESESRQAVVISLKDKLSDNQMECSRLKTSFSQAKSEADARFKKELRVLQRQMEEISRKSVQEIKKMEGEVYAMHSAFVEELKQERDTTAKRWSRKLEEACKQEADKGRKIHQEMRSIAEELSEERRALSRCKRETRERIEALEAEVNESRQEIEKMEKKNASRTKEEAIQTRSKMKELEIEMEIRESSWGEEKRGLQEQQQAKEKEIQELHSMIAKQFRKVNQQKENIMLASQLGSEVKALTQRIHQK